MIWLSKIFVIDAHLMFTTSRYTCDDISWWRHQMEFFPRYWPSVSGIHRWPIDSPQRPVTWSFNISFDIRLNKGSNKQSRRWWFGTPSRSLWRHCNVGKHHSHMKTNETGTTGTRRHKLVTNNAKSKCSVVRHGWLIYTCIDEWPDAIWSDQSLPLHSIWTDLTIVLHSKLTQ